MKTFSKMNFKTAIFVLSLLGSVLSEDEYDGEHEKLHQMANDIMKKLQSSHLPTQGSNTAPNAPLHHLNNVGQHVMNSADIEKTVKTKISVGVKGIQFVSIEMNGKVVNITTKFGVGAAAVYNIDKDDFENELEEKRYENYISEESVEEIERSLESMKEEYLEDNLTAGPNETKLLFGQKTKFGMKIESKNPTKPGVKVVVDHGYIVATKTNVTKGFNYN